MKTFGKFSIVIAGLTLLLAGCGGGHSSAPVQTTNTTNPTVTSISVGSQGSSIPVGMTEQFTATATMSDGSIQNVTASVTWSSTAPGVATISNGGLATGVAQGQATIKAALNSVSGTMNLSITAPIVTSITVNPQNPSIALGTSQQFTVDATLSDGSHQNMTSSATWSSSANNVATVDSAGLCSSKAMGNATIFASVNSVNGSASLNVGPAVLSSISVKPANSSMAQGTHKQFNATGIYTDGSTQDMTTSVTWNSSNTNVATINAAGLATAKNQGNTSISATSGQINGAVNASVTPASLVSIVITPPNILLPLGLTAQLTATGLFSDNSTQDLTASVTWNSSNVAKVSVNASGVAHALQPGGVTISASLNSVTGNASLTASAAVLTGIQVTPGTISIAAGTHQQLTATGVFSDGSTNVLSTGVTWSSSAQANATVDSSGMVSALVAGNLNITATVGAISGSASLDVTAAALTSIVVTPAIDSVSIGANVQFTATGVFTDLSVQDLTASVHWSSSNGSLCIISNAAGNAGAATALGAGQILITATLGAISGSASLTVNPATLVSISIAPVNLSLALGTSVSLTATGHFSDGSSQDITANVTWSSSATGVSVNALGLVTAITANTSAQLTASLGGVKGSVTVSVPTALVSISVSASASSLALGTSLQVTAIGHFNDGSTQDLTASVTWSSSNSACVVVGPSGLSSALALGSVTVTASLGGISGTASLTATSAVLVSISVTPTNGVVSLLSPLLQFHATGHFSDGSTQDLTAQVQWSSSNNLLAIISNLLGHCGLATRVAIGTVTITAKLNGISGSVSLQSIL